MKNLELIYKICVTLGLVILLDVILSVAFGLGIGITVLFSAMRPLVSLETMYLIGYVYSCSWVVFFAIAILIKLFLIGERLRVTKVSIKERFKMKKETQNFFLRTFALLSVILITFYCLILEDKFTSIWTSLLLSFFIATLVTISRNWYLEAKNKKNEAG